MLTGPPPKFHGTWDILAGMVDGECARQPDVTMSSSRRSGRTGAHDTAAVAAVSAAKPLR